MKRSSGITGNFLFKKVGFSKRDLLFKRRRFILILRRGLSFERIYGFSMQRDQLAKEALIEKVRNPKPKKWVLGGQNQKPKPNKPKPNKPKPNKPKPNKPKPNKPKPNKPKPKNQSPKNTKFLFGCRRRKPKTKTQK